MECARPVHKCCYMNINHMSQLLRHIAIVAPNAEPQTMSTTAINSRRAASPDQFCWNTPPARTMATANHTLTVLRARAVGSFMPRSHCIERFSQVFADFPAAAGSWPPSHLRSSTSAEIRSTARASTANIWMLTASRLCTTSGLKNCCSHPRTSPRLANPFASFMTDNPLPEDEPCPLDAVRCISITFLWLKQVRPLA